AEVVGTYAGFHGVPLTVVDPSGAVLVEGGGPAKLCAAVRTGPAGGHACGGSADCQKGHLFYKEALLHDGSVVGWLIIGPYARGDVRPVAEHVARVLGNLNHAAYARQLTARIHSVTISETYNQLQEKNRFLAAAVERMQEVDRLKSNFLATVSH